MDPDRLAFDGSPGDLKDQLSGSLRGETDVAAQALPTFCSQPFFPYNREDRRRPELLLMMKTERELEKQA